MNQIHDLPHNLRAEESVLAALLKHGAEALKQLETLTPEHFLVRSHGIIFATCRELQRRGEAVDASSVTCELERTARLKEVGGVFRIEQLASAYETTAGIGFYANLLHEQLTLRRIIEASAKHIRLVKEGQASLDEILERAAADIERIRTNTTNDASAQIYGVEADSLENLLNFDTKNDPNALIGDRWLCRRGSVLLVGSSGIGKSSLMMQLAMLWSVGLPCFGLTPKRPLKFLILQAENDQGDLAEMVQGVLDGMRDAGILADETFDLMCRNIVIRRVTFHTGTDFARVATVLVKGCQPDVVWVDPLLSYVGDDLGQGKVAADFLRKQLQRLASETGVAWALLHHPTKPKSDAGARSHWTAADYSYLGFGSSDVTNWARAIVWLQQTKLGNGSTAYKLHFLKRGKRAGARDLHGNPTTTLWLQHAEYPSISWTQIEEQTEQQAPRGPRPKKLGQLDLTLKFLPERFDWSDGLKAVLEGMSGTEDAAGKRLQRLVKRGDLRKDRDSETGKTVYVKQQCPAAAGSNPSASDPTLKQDKLL